MKTYKGFIIEIIPGFSNYSASVTRQHSLSETYETEIFRKTKRDAETDARQLVNAILKHDKEGETKNVCGI